MKKFLLLSVMAAAAFSASAYDTFAPGTDAEHPNYYLIRTNRGKPFLSYSVDELANGNRAATHLYRAESATEYSLWAVSPGVNNGSVVVKNYKENAYLVDYPNNGSGTTAVTVSEPVDLYLVTNENKSFSIGSGTSGSVFLDANNWNDNCGNWNAGDEGTTWFATLVDLTNGADVNSAIQQALVSVECSQAKAAAIADLKHFQNVAIISDIISEGISQIENVEATENYQNDINAIINDVWSKNNAMIHTGLNGKTFGVQNMRRAAAGLNAFFEVNTESNTYPACATMAGVNALFEFKSVENNGYKLYNKATETYVGPSQVPTSNEADAQIVYPMFVQNTGAGMYGIALPFEPNVNAQSFNMDQNASTKLVQWSVDNGSYWNLIEFDEQTVLDDLTSTYINHLNEYAANVEPAAEVFAAAIAKIEALSFSADVAEKAVAIETEAINSANEYLKAGLDNKSVQVRSLRSGYIIPKNDRFAVSASATEDSNFDFLSAEDGGYVIYTPSANKYMGSTIESTQMGGELDMSLVEDKAEAVKVYPVVYSCGDYYGVAFPLSDAAEPTTQGLNANGRGLHPWDIFDAGSIFAIKVMGPATEINEITVANAAAEGIYDLAGRRLSAPVRGINIINGKKVLVK